PLRSVLIPTARRPRPARQSGLASAASSRNPLATEAIRASPGPAQAAVISVQGPVQTQGHWAVLGTTAACPPLPLPPARSSTGHGRRSAARNRAEQSRRRLDCARSGLDRPRAFRSALFLSAPRRYHH